VRSDRRLLRRVLQNLVSNALRYTHSGGVLLGPRWHRGQLEIQVLDTGPGIAVQHQRAIFEEFQRLDHPSPWGEKGLGLGLSICERMARLLGHPLSLRSTPGRGSCFGVRVPRVAVQATRPPRAALAGAPSLAADLGAMRVLCLDNDHSILDGMRALLERWGLTVDMAASVDEAERTLTLNMPDVILADYHLHDRMEGLDALDHLRALANGCSPSGALITADGSDALADDARRRGYALLRKPLKPAALRALLASFAQKRSVDAEVL
jgi:CheY-like chemotaxis protein